MAGRFRIRTGVDIIASDRVAGAYRRRPESFLRHLFTRKEQRQLAVRNYAARHLAARFAGKEAIFKLLGMGMGQLCWKEVEILSLPGGEPRVYLHGRAKARAKELSLVDIALSLSHCREYAVAQACALAEGGAEDK